MGYLLLPAACPAAGLKDGHGEAGLFPLGKCSRDASALKDIRTQQKFTWRSHNPPSIPTAVSWSAAAGWTWVFVGGGGRRSGELKKNQKNHPNNLFSSPPDKCGDTIKILNPGYLTSPGYPQSYHPSQKCEWLIQAPEPYQRIMINFNPHFDLEDRDCK